MSFKYFDLTKINSLKDVEEQSSELKKRHYDLVGFKQNDPIIYLINEEVVRLEMVFKYCNFEKFKKYVLSK